MPVHIYAGPGKETGLVGTYFRRHKPGGGAVYDKRLLAQYFLVGISAGSGNWSGRAGRVYGEERERAQRQVTVMPDSAC